MPSHAIPAIDSQTQPTRTALSLYVCPKCKGGLEPAENSLLCARCDRSYSVRENIPDFISENLRESANWSLRHSTWFDWLAPIYETRLWYPVVMKLAGAKGVSSLPDLLTTIEEMTGTVSGNVLDVACGPGSFGRRIAKHSQSVFGIDISAGMLQQGRRYAQREGVTNIHFARARVEGLPFAADTFAGALCCGSLHLFEDPVGALREIRRTLTSEARLVGFTFVANQSRFSRFSHEHGARFFNQERFGTQLQEAGYSDYDGRTFGSALLFRARKR